MYPQFCQPLLRSIPNALTDENFSLVPLNTDFYLLDTYAQIVAICNQPLIYHWLFSENLGGQPYTQKNAEDFVEWSHQGWKAGTHFVFLILTPQQSIAGAIDIKSNNLESGEIGYWMSAEYPGVMTNTIKELALIAHQAGYQELFALVRETNIKSIGVLQRTGFSEDERIKRQNKEYKRFLLQLNSS